MKVSIFTNNTMTGLQYAVNSFLEKKGNIILDVTLSHYKEGNYMNHVATILYDEDKYR